MRETGSCQDHGFKVCKAILSNYIQDNPSEKNHKMLRVCGGSGKADAALLFALRIKLPCVLVLRSCNAYWQEKVVQDLNLDISSLRQQDHGLLQIYEA